MFSQASCIGVSLIQSKIFEVVMTASKLLFVTKSQPIIFLRFHTSQPAFVSPR